MNNRGWKVAAALALASLMGLSSAHAAAGQKESGIVVVPAPGRVAVVWVEGCPGGVVEGSLGWLARASLHSHFSVKSSTWGLPFSVTPAHRLADIDITFRTASNWIRYATRGLGGESGIVPVGAIEAVVCLSIGAPSRFTYLAGSGA